MGAVSCFLSLLQKPERECIISTVKDTVLAAEEQRIDEKKARAQERVSRQEKFTYESRSLMSPAKRKKVWSHGVDVLVRGAAIDIDTTVISHGNDIPRLRTLDELISSRKPQSHVSKVAKITYEDEDRPFNVGSELKDNTPKWTSEDNRNEEIGKAIQFMKFISNVDNFLASKAKELLRGMHNMISDKGNLGAIFSVDSEDSRDHGRMPRLLMESWPGYDEDRHGWTKREIGKPDPDLQAKRIQDLEKAKKFMQIVGQVDAYVSDRAKTLLKSLHNIIDHRQGSSSGFSNRL